MAAQTRLDKDARRRRRNQMSGSSTRTVREPDMKHTRLCGNCHHCGDHSFPAYGYCPVLGGVVSKNDRADRIPCSDHQFNSEVT